MNKQPALGTRAMTEDTRRTVTGDDIRSLKHRLGLDHACDCRGLVHPVRRPPTAQCWRRTRTLISSATGATLTFHEHRDRPGEVLVQVEEHHPDGEIIEAAFLADADSVDELVAALVETRSRATRSTAVRR